MKNRISIKAAVLEKNNSDLTIKKIFHENKLSSNQVLVKLFYTGICGSQIGEIDGVKGKDKYLPHLLGHEATGKVLKVSKNEKEFKKNDRVILHWQRNTQKDCANPNYFDEKNKKINAGWVTTFNDLAIVSKNRLTKLPNDIDAKKGVLFGCVLTTSYGAIFKDSKINLKIKNKILINGFGMIGQTILKLLQNNNQEIWVLENNLKKINFLIKNFSRVKCCKKINELKFNYFDIIYETTGNNMVIEKSYNIMKNNSKLILIGVPRFNAKIKINTLGINYGKKLIGSYGGGIKPKKDLVKISNYLIKKKINLKNLYAGPFKFKSINSILKSMKQGKIINKPILKF
jgi:S-(hydroxymethyl)glutathione dehydrogenase / alcohol dehydrogenase